ncbi:MAG: hypothetical protein KAJ18_01880 [Candidatus Omnitrophica bacterium]|nr:hypothetical protein [Candidatus Omnitrophota bacterium]
MINGWHVTAQDIIKWTDTDSRRAQEVLPYLIQKLILASTNCSSLHFPNGESISKKGWDGTLSVKTDNPFVSAGKSVWELSTNRNIKSKATKDYNKRTNDSKGEKQESTTFMFATFRNWTNKSQWENEKKADNRWKDVKILDADDLKTWLELCPAVHRWFATLIGKRSGNMQDIEHAWDSWRHVTNPATSIDLVIAGRNQRVEEIVQQLRNHAKVLRIRSESREESFSFILAVIQCYLEFQSRCLIITKESDWDAVIYEKNSLILIPQYDNPTNIGLAVQQGHHVILPQSRIEGSQQDIVDIGPAVKSKLINALVNMELEEEDAKAVIHVSRGFINSIRRHSKLNPQEPRIPIWAKPEYADVVIPVLLAGGWTADNQNDCEKVAELAGLKYNEFEAKLYKLMSSCDDHAIRRVSSVWQIFSRHDAWVLLSKYINPAFLNRFCKTAKSVLKELDPRFEISPNERWMANIMDKKAKYSGVLRHGLAESIAMLGSYGEQDCVGMQGESVQDKISVLVRQLLIDNMSGHQWWSLSGDLPLFGEAAPDVFLDAIEEGFKGDRPPLMDLFAEEGTFGGCSHSGLLWALEGISWSQKHLSRTIQILAKLARLDPGGEYSNRPINTLKEMFLGWRPHTKASLEERVQILTSLMKVEPDICWTLLLGLLPNQSGISMNIHQPYFRNWAEGWEPTITNKDYYKHILAINRLCLSHVEQKPDKRWPELIEEMPHMPEVCFNDAFEMLNKKDKKDFLDDTSIHIRETLRDIVAKHRRHSKADWALPKEAVDRLEGVLNQFMPEDIVIKHQFLFDKHFIDLMEVDEEIDFKRQEKLIDSRRLEALEAIWKLENLEGIKRLASMTKSPWIVGGLLAKTTFGKSIETSMFDCLEDTNESLVLLAQAYISSRYFLDPKWLTAIFDNYRDKWELKRWNRFCVKLPFIKDTFELLKKLPREVFDHYWENVNGYYLQKNDAIYVNWIIEELLKHKRPLAAIDAAMMALHASAKEAELKSELIATALEQAVVEPETDRPSSHIGYETGEAIKYLQTKGDIDTKRLSLIEWIYVPMFSDRNVRPTVLIKEILTDPTFFVYLLRLMYKASPPIENEFPEFLDDKKTKMAINADRLLDLVQKIPGQQESGSLVDAKVLKDWVTKVRQDCTQSNRADIGDHQIGKLLAYCPSGIDEVWPHEAVREILEEEGTQEIALGMEIGRYNQRGITSRAIGAGGDQERKIAASYEESANKISLNWPRTAAMLYRMAGKYKREAKRWDDQTKLEDF